LLSNDDHYLSEDIIGTPEEEYIDEEELTADNFKQESYEALMIRKHKVCFCFLISCFYSIKIPVFFSIETCFF
jgi:hypothetical protein